MNNYTPQQIAEIDRHLAYIKKQNMASLINFIMCIVAVIGIVACVIWWPYDEVKPIKKQINDTVYTYYRGEEGYIRLHKPKDFNPIYDHSEIIKHICNE